MNDYLITYSADGINQSVIVGAESRADARRLFDTREFRNWLGYSNAVFVRVEAC